MGNLVESCRDEFRDFAARTTMKGTPRIIRSEWLWLRIFWIFAVILLLLGGSYHLYKLISSYLSYGAVSDFQEHMLHPSDPGPPFPLATICSKNPFPMTSTWPEGIISPQEFRKMLDEKFRCHGDCTQERLDDLRYISDRLKSPEGYFEYIGIDKAKLVGQKAEAFFADCEILVLKGYRIAKYPCGEYITIIEDFFKEYFNCFEIVPDAEKVAMELGVFVGVELYIYLDAYSPGATMNNTFWDTTGFTSGALATLSEPGPSGSALIELDGFDIPAGSAVDLSLGLSRITRLKPPYGICKSYIPKEKYSQKLCYMKCFEHRIAEECNCFHPTSPITESRSENLPFCLSAFNPVDTLIQNGRCMDSVLLKWVANCTDQCPLPCEANKYPYDVSKISWPSINSYRNFYKKLIHGKEYQEEYKDMRDVAVTNNCSSHAECEIKLSKTERLLQANFAKFTYRVADSLFVEIKTVKKMNDHDLVSQLGAALNLWSGISVVFIIEIIEMILRICRKIGKCSAKSVKITTTNQAQQTSKTMHCSTCSCVI